MPRKRKDAVDRSMFEVASNQLQWECDPASLGFLSTETLEPLEGHMFINQPRAEQAIQLGVSLSGNLFIVTPDGSITSVLIANLRKNMGGLPDGGICDRVCVHNRNNPEKPEFIVLPKGEAIPFRLRIKKLMESLKHKIPSTLNGNECLEKRQCVFVDFEANIDKARRVFEEAWQEAVVETDEIGKLTFFVPKEQDGKEGVDAFGNVDVWAGQVMRGTMPGRESEGEVDIFYRFVALDKFRKLSNESKEKVNGEVKKKVEEIQVKFLQMSGEISRLSEAMLQRIVRVREDFVREVFQGESEEILVSYGEAVSAFMEALREHTIEHVEAFLPQENENSNKQHFPRPDPFGPFEINVFVDNGETDGVPILDDRNPTEERLFGYVHQSPYAGKEMPWDPNWNHMAVRAGALSRAEGGYLVLPARAVFSDPSVWSRLKAVLESRWLDIGAGGAGKGMIDPETLPVNVRVVLVGDYLIYRMLQGHPWMRQDFEDLFKVVAEFDWTAPRTNEIIHDYARFIRLLCDRGNLPQVSADGVVEILKFMSRHASAQDKLSLDGRLCKEVISEAGFVSRRDASASLITGEHVKEALERRVYRSDLVREKMYELIKDGTLLFQKDESVIGQIHGLAVLDPGSFAFGMPMRIIAKTFVGRQGVISIERAVELSGRTHDKGVLILSGYLLEKYGHDRQVFFSASISFEQSYGRVEGDSASSTELYVLLSSLSGLPIRQDIAVTGSVNQKGEIQPIGGVNEKIEGFFDICCRFGLTGNEGVIIPSQNVKDLMLRDNVIEAVREGKFHIYAVQTIDEGIEILTGRKAGVQIKQGERKGQYPSGTVHCLVDQRLRALTRAAGRSQE